MTRMSGASGSAQILPSRRASILLSFLVVMILPFVSGCGASRAGAGAVRSGSPAPPVPETPDPLIPEAYHYFTSGNLLAAAGNDSGAVANYRRALNYDPTSYEIRLSLAQAYGRLRQYDEAAIMAEGIRPRTLDVLQFLGTIYTHSRNFRRRLAVYEEWVAQDSTNARVWQFLASTYQTQGDTLQWLWALEHLSAIQPDPAVYEQLGLLRLSTGAADSAEAWFHRARLADSGQQATRVLLGLAQIWAERDEPDSAYAYYAQAVALNYYNTELRRRFFYFLLQQRRGDEAIEQARQILQLSPDEPDILYRLAVVEYDQGALDSAEVHLTRWIARYGDDGLGRLLLGRIALDRGDSVTAEAHYLQCLEVTDTLPEVYLSLAFMHSAREQFDTAAAIYERGLRALPDLPGLLFGLGASLERGGHFDSSVNVFERLIALRPDHAPALNYLGYMWADRGVRLGEALELIKRALELQPENGAYLDSYAWALFRLGRYRDAEAKLRQALDYIQDDAIVFEHYGDILARLGRMDEALEHWQRALELDPDNVDLREKLNR